MSKEFIQTVEYLNNDLNEHKPFTFEFINNLENLILLSRKSKDLFLTITEIIKSNTNNGHRAIELFDSALEARSHIVLNALLNYLPSGETRSYIINRINQETFEKILEFADYDLLNKILDDKKGVDNKKTAEIIKNLQPKIIERFNLAVHKNGDDLAELLFQLIDEEQRSSIAVKVFEKVLRQQNTDIRIIKLLMENIKPEILKRMPDNLGWLNPINSFLCRSSLATSRYVMGKIFGEPEISDFQYMNNICRISNLDHFLYNSISALPKYMDSFGNRLSFEEDFLACVSNKFSNKISKESALPILNICKNLYTNYGFTPLEIVNMNIPAMYKLMTRPENAALMLACKKPNEQLNIPFETLVEIMTQDCPLPYQTRAAIVQIMQETHGAIAKNPHPREQDTYKDERELVIGDATARLAKKAKENPNIISGRNQ